MVYLVSFTDMIFDELKRD